jgi:hypothetical protein
VWISKIGGLGARFVLTFEMWVTSHLLRFSTLDLFLSRTGKFAVRYDNFPNERSSCPSPPCRHCKQASCTASARNTISPTKAAFSILIKSITYRSAFVFYLSLCSAALSLCLRFLNQLETCVVVRPVASANSLFSLGLG